ncbi:FG-GAP repeat domain-containing protein [Streptomyces sp. NPDC048305]|uniref:FG-GAP repeat domain-containing protein n=1 Tax=Streptomyces sp. NPDC048305 TaxID=3365532 RepID=UPI003710AE63
MPNRALRSGVVAASLVLSVTAGMSPAAHAAPPSTRYAAAAVAEAPAEPVVVPARMSTSVQPFTLVSTNGAQEADTAGELGVFSRVPGTSDYRWTRFSDGADFPAGPTGTGTVTRMYGTGTDTIAYLRDGEVELRDMVAGTTSFVRIPEGLTFSGVYGHTVVAVKLVVVESGGTTRTTAPEAHLLDARADGTTRDRTVTGLPEGAMYWLSQAAAAGDENGILLRYIHEGVGRMALVDVATGQLSQSSAHIRGAAPGYLLTPRHVVWFSYGADSTISVVPRSDLGATPRVLTSPAPAERNSYHLAVVGDWLLHNKGNSALTATPLDGGAPRVILKSARTDIAGAADGSAVVVGGATGYASDTTWGVYRLVEGADGAPAATRVVDLSAPPLPVQGLGLGAGKLTVVTRRGDLREGTERTLAVQGSPAAGPAAGSFISFDGRCAAEDPDCQAVHATGTGEPVVLVRHSSAGDDQIQVSMGSSVSTGLTGGTLTDTDGEYAVYTHPASHQQIVYSTYRSEKLLTRTPVASALWAGTLWSAGTVPGTVTSYDLAAGRTTATVSLGSGCAPDELQALGRWLYWTCGTSGGAGVFDRTTGKSLSVPVGEALLGDGYLVRHDKAAGKLVLTDLVASAASGSAVTRVVGDLPATATPQRRITWNVDRYGGHLTYVDTAQRVHIVPTGVPTQPLSAYEESWTGMPGAISGTWTYQGKLSKPASSWKAVFTDLRTGKVARTVSGGETRGNLYAEWDNLDDSGRPAVNGRYGWKLTVQPADGHGTPLVRSGEVALTGGAAAWRDFIGNDGLGDLFVVVDETSLGRRPGKLPGTVGPLAGYWGMEDLVAQRILPTGDLDGDGCNDYLGAKNDGTLLRLDGTCTPGEDGAPREYTQIGSGWKSYDMFAPGDIDGDGIADLLARQHSTGYLFLYPGDGKGKLKARTQIGVGWNGLTVVGAGDLTGDGFGDLLVRDGAGVLWRYDGTGTGRVAPKVRIGAGWEQYDALAAVGDVTGDGKNDLFARDESGVLWRYTGTGTGSFETRVKLGPGWKAYPTVF